MLPDSRGKTDRPGKFVDTAIPALIEQMEQLAGQELKLTAKMAGGASMFSTTVPPRTSACKTLQPASSCLRDLRIPILARHCGGEQGRRMTFDTDNGNVVIEIVGQDPIELK